MESAVVAGVVIALLGLLWLVAFCLSVLRQIASLEGEVKYLRERRHEDLGRMTDVTCEMRDTFELLGLRFEGSRPPQRARWTK